MRRSALKLLAPFAALSLTGCMTVGQSGRDLLPEQTSLAYFPKKTQTQNLLNQLPPPQRQVAIAVYGFTDQTGQFKPTNGGQTLSRAVTQGASAMLVKALQETGNRDWFTVVERERLDNLLKERQIIGEMRKRYLGEEQIDPNALPALLFAGVLLEGGIVGYDTNTVTGGAGAAFLGIGARTEYRQDTVTVYLRAVSVRTGEVLTNVTASKTIASQALGASAYRFVAFKELLEAEWGITANEPDQVALQQAIEKAVYGLVLEGVELDLWRFENMAAAQPILSTYRAERDGIYEARDVQAAVRKAGSLSELTIVEEEDDNQREGS
ncbi:curli production assembly/transport component CsgG [Altererythrobacter xiamenensis]|uniref:Curli production assembly/transport component CsgG n=1 Tax=Altererythrobacter xiamenensis TaxID=1316679 RepID=A0A1Y6EQ49_9SPHN|nr:CsgG/HfaB family protein [Altererythrobacter xiamenensis]SMQ63100.1 curli production assembly/transport component CsgG [Altererythrobacter xiamenensis]